MCWIGARKGRVGGNPGSVNKSEGDLPSAIERGGGSNCRMKNLTAVLMGSSAAGRGKREPLVPWKSPPSAAASSGVSVQAAAVSARDTDKTVGGPGRPKMSVELPTWIKTDARLCYLSKSNGKVHEVVVEMVNSAKSEVEITFVGHSKVWKVLPFSLITSSSNPLLGPWAASSVEHGTNNDLLLHAQENRVDKREMLRRLKTSTVEEGQLEQGREEESARERSRSRSPETITSVAL